MEEGRIKLRTETLDEILSVKLVFSTPLHPTILTASYSKIAELRTPLRICTLVSTIVFVRVCASAAQLCREMRHCASWKTMRFEVRCHREHNSLS